MAVTCFAHMGLNCVDPLKIEKFYSKHFGFERRNVFVKDSDEQIIMIGNGKIYIELFSTFQVSKRKNTEITGPEGRGWRHICFSVEDLEEKLSQIGEDLKITHGPVKLDNFVPGMKACWIEDPEGNVIELCEGYRDW
ncbi:MAG: putative lyase [Firmicutes bacterium ADurb.Bin419]|nr:MAG: putative lyase [Firmicutes bacterium ADurb.Bin419]